MARKSPLFPADPWVRSLVTEKRLQELMRDGLLHPRTNLRSVGVEGTADQPPGTGAAGGLRGQLRRLP
jgi:hypothetical protein